MRWQVEQARVHSHAPKPSISRLFSTAASSTVTDFSLVRLFTVFSLKSGLSFYLLSCSTPLQHVQRPNATTQAWLGASPGPPTSWEATVLSPEWALGRRRTEAKHPLSWPYGRWLGNYRMECRVIRAFPPTLNFIVTSDAHILLEKMVNGKMIRSIVEQMGGKVYILSL